MFGWLKNLLPAPKPGTEAYRHQMLSAAHEAYRLARKDRPREFYQPSGYSGDSAIATSHDMMHRRVRDLVRNTAQTKRIVTAFVDLVIGTGLQTYAWPFLPSEMFDLVTEIETIQQEGTLGPRLRYALESDDLFDEWFSDPKQFDAEGRMSGAEIFRMQLGECVQVGNGLLVRKFRRKFDLVPLCFQLIEREQLDESQDRDAGPGRNKIVGGVEVDANNQTVAYHVYIDHPQDMWWSAQSAMSGGGVGLAAGERRMRIPTERVIDLAMFHRPSATLGISWFDASGQSSWDRDNYIGSEIQSAAIDAVFTFIAKLVDSENYQGVGFADSGDDEDTEGNRLYKVGRSPVASVISPEEDLQMVRQTRPNKDAGPFLKLLDRDISSAHGLSYYTVTGDYEATNFSSSRAAKLDEDLHVRPLQSWFATRTALPIRRQFNAVAAAAGLYQSISPSEFRRNQRRYQRFDAIGQGRELLDPFKEGEARTSRLRTGISTFKEECARRGQHWIRILMQLAIEKRICELFGVVLDFSKSGADDQGSDQQQDEQAAQSDAISSLLGDIQ